MITDYPPAHRLSVNVLLSNVTFFVIFAVLDVSFAVNLCINHSFLHLYLQFYYVSVAVIRCSGYVVRGTWYGVRGPHNFWGVPVAQQPLPSLVLNLSLQLTTVQTVRTACTTVWAVITACTVGPSISCCISQCPVHYSVKFDANIFIQSGATGIFYFT